MLRGRPMLVRIGLIFLLLGVSLQGARAETGDAAPAACRLGINVAALYDLDSAKGSFGADLWLWKPVPTQEPSPLSRVELPTAKVGTQFRPVRGEPVVGGYYESRSVRGLFRHHWDMRRYPFDRQQLVIRLEEPELGADRLVFVADAGNWSASSGIEAELGGEWRVDGFRVAAGTAQEDSRYGYPEAEPSRYAWLQATVELQRSSVLTFVKLTLAVYAAALFAILCLYFDPRQAASFQNQVPFLVAVLFAIIINHRRSDDIIGDIGRLTLVTEIHLITILLTILVAMLVFLDRRRAERGVEVRYLDRVAIFGTAAGYAGLVLVLILAAALRGSHSSFRLGVSASHRLTIGSMGELISRACVLPTAAGIKLTDTYACRGGPRRSIRRRRRCRNTYAQHMALKGDYMRQRNNFKGPLTSEGNTMRKSKTSMRKLVLSGIVLACGMAGTAQAASTLVSAPVVGGQQQAQVACVVVNWGSTPITFVTKACGSIHGSSNAGLQWLRRNAGNEWHL